MLAYVDVVHKPYVGPKLISTNLYWRIWIVEIDDAQVRVWRGMVDRINHGAFWGHEDVVDISDSKSKVSTTSSSPY